MKSYVYELKLTVRDYELDFEGIVNNAVYMNYLDIPAMSFSNKQVSISPSSIRRGLILSLLMPTYNTNTL